MQTGALSVCNACLLGATETGRQSNQVAVRETDRLTDRGDEAGKLADRQRKMLQRPLIHLMHFRTQLRLQTDTSSKPEKDRKTTDKTTDNAKD